MPTTTYRFKRWRKTALWMAVGFTALGLSQVLMLWTSLSATEASGMEIIAEAMPWSLASPALILAMLICLISTIKPGGMHREYLRLDDVGLTYGNLFGAHHWPWRDISTFALHGKTGRNVRVTFAVPGKLARSVNQTDTRVLIEDIYDTPLTDIAAKLNDFRDQALSHPAST